MMFLGIIDILGYLKYSFEHYGLGRLCLVGPICIFIRFFFVLNGRFLFICLSWGEVTCVSRHNNIWGFHLIRSMCRPHLRKLQPPSLFHLGCRCCYANSNLRYSTILSFWRNLWWCFGVVLDFAFFCVIVGVLATTWCDEGRLLCITCIFLCCAVVFHLWLCFICGDSRLRGENSRYCIRIAHEVQRPKDKDPMRL